MNREFRNTCFFLLGIAIAFVLFMPRAHAQTYVQWDASGNIVGTLANSTRKTFIDTYGVVDQVTGQVVVKGTETAVAVGAKVEKAAISKAAAKIATKAIPGVGTAIALAELCTLLCPNGYQQGDDGAFKKVEQPDIPGDAPGTGYAFGDSYKSKSAQSACNAFAQAVWDGGQYKNDPANSLTMPAPLSGLTCTVQFTATYSPTYSQSFTITTRSLDRVPNFYVPQYVLATEVQTEADIALRAEQQAKFKPIYDAIRADAKNAGGSWPQDYDPIKPSTPVVVTAPPVTSPEKTVSTTTQSKPDGSIDTTVKTEKTVVTPTTTGTTTGDSKTTFPSQTVTTSTTINNVTNNTTTNVTTEEHPADEKPSEDQKDPCDDHPLRAGCAELGQIPPAEQIPKQDIPVSYTPIIFSSAAGCPAPITFELFGARSISYQPYCDVMSFLRPIFLLIGAVTCAWIFMDGLKA